MPFFVVTSQLVKPDRLAQVLTTMRGDLATSHLKHPGRRSSRIFQHLDQQNHLMALAEWDSRADYERLWRTPRYQELTVRADPPARIEEVTRLRSFTRMSMHPAYVGCVRFTVPSEHAAAFEVLVLGDLRHDVEAADGIVSHEFFRISSECGCYLVVHGWRSMQALERFRHIDRPRHDLLMEQLGVTAERFTGSVAVLFTRQEPPTLTASYA